MGHRFLHLIFALCLPGAASAQSLGTYGTVGLIDMPSAPVMADGNVAFSHGQTGGTGRTTVAFQLSPRVEGAVRYTDIDGFGSSGGRSDREFDLKVNILQEPDAPFSLALGFRDALGAAVHSSEYLVASKRLAPGLEVTGGLGWGRLASAGSFDNPFGGRRDRVPGGEEAINLGDAFKGDSIGVFGGVSWQPEGSRWRFKAEYSSDDYRAEVASGQHERSSSWNFGVERDLGAGFDAGIYSIGGDEIGFRLSFSADPGTPRTPPDYLNGPGPFTARPADGKRGTNWASNTALKEQLIGALRPLFASEGIPLKALDLHPERVEVQIENERHSRPSKAAGRAARLLASGMPPSVERFDVTLMEGDVPVTTVALERSDLEALVDTHAAIPESWRRFELAPATPLDGPIWQAPPGGLSYAVGPTVPIALLGGDLDYDVVLQAEAQYDISPGFSLNAVLSQSLLGQFGDASLPSGTLPQVRSNLAAYQSDQPVLERATADYVTKLGDALYVRGSAGFLERMFAGVSGEVLWQPGSDRLSYGLELNYARQRAPEAFTGLDRYSVVTGHGSLYWETGWNGVEAQIDAGRYLAGDWGATLTLSRQLGNGWHLSGFVTGTDADTSASRSGSFDKGIRLTIPLGWTVPYPTRDTIGLSFADLARDDGARLDLDGRLYERIRGASTTRLERSWTGFWQ